MIGYKDDTDWVFKIFPFLFVAVFVMIFIYWIFVGILAFKGIDLIQKDGLKSVINRVWEGEK